MAGSAGAPAAGSGSYWTETAAYPGASYSLPVTPDRAGAVATQIPESGFSVRCVRAREGQALPCFFPLAGSVLYPEQLAGQYWTSSIGIVEGQSGDQPIVLTLRPGDGFVQGQSVGLGCSVRCVRAREEQAIPLFWIVWFWVL